MQFANVFSIPPDLKFLPTLVDRVLDGTLLPEGYDISDPLALADISIYLPTQRSVRLLEKMFLQRAGKNAIILPNIKSLGSGESEDEVYFQDEPLDIPADETIPPAISLIARQIILAQLILSWGAAMRESNGEEAAYIPRSATQAAWLASDLGELLDRAATEEISWSGLKDLVPEDYAAFWQISLEFLKIATEHWPQILKERGMCEKAERRDRLLDLECQRIGSITSPVIAAGSTGTLPSTARLLSAIARHPSGALVLPGLDFSMGEETFEAMIGLKKDIQPEPGHPQFGLNTLLTDYIKIKRDEVKEIGPREPIRARRSDIVSKAMLPTEFTDQWLSLRTDLAQETIDAAFKNVCLIEARNDAEEAMAIACAIREFVEYESGEIALITPDRALARRVALELQRWDLFVDDSAGRPIAKTQPAILALLILEVLEKDFAPAPLLALLKHPQANFGMDKGDVRRAARVLDIAILRGPRLTNGSKGILKRLKDLADELLGGTGREPESALEDEISVPKNPRGLHPSVKALGQEDFSLAVSLATAVQKCFSTLENLVADGKSLPLRKLAQAHFTAYEQIASSTLQQDPAHSAVITVFTDIENEPASSINVSPLEFQSVFSAILGTKTIRSIGTDDPRILILGALEARLLHPQCVILAGMDEGSWPRNADTDAFMSRGMRAGIGLEMPERRIGLAAHDVIQGMGADRVILSRAHKRGGSPAVRSRWLQRLAAFSGESVTNQMAARGERYLEYARAFNLPRQVAKPHPAPKPRPPVEIRPTKLSVTRIETWIRDPYIIYADYILGLKPVEPLGKMPDFSTRGTIIHDILDRFAKGWDESFDESALERLNEIGHLLFKSALGDFPDQFTLWWPRFQKIAEAYVKWECARDDSILKRNSEISAGYAYEIDGQEFKITGTADRIDEKRDGTLALIDFKTGRVPTAKEAKVGFAAQLPLEVAMIKRGAFNFVSPFSSRPISEIGWLKFDGLTNEPKFTSALIKPKKGEVGDTAEDLGDLAEDQLIKIVRAYRNQEKAYLSRPRPDFEITYESPYDHLARVKEWRLSEESDQ